MSSYIAMNFPHIFKKAGRKSNPTQKGIVPLYPDTQLDKTLSTTFLTSHSRLREIYDLRLEAWEGAGKSEVVNREFFPNGWVDELDESAFHWVTLNQKLEIVAAARLNLFPTLAEFPFCDSVQHLRLPVAVPFAFFSRLVVHPSYRNNGLSRELYLKRAEFCKRRRISWSQVFINNPQVIRLFQREGYACVGQAEVAYHTSSKPHTVNVFVSETPQKKASSLRAV